MFSLLFIFDRNRPSFLKPFPCLCLPTTRLDCVWHGINTYKYRYRYGHDIDIWYIIYTLRDVDSSSCFILIIYNNNYYYHYILLFIPCVSHVYRFDMLPRMTLWQVPTSLNLFQQEQHFSCCAFSRPRQAIFNFNGPGHWEAEIYWDNHQQLTIINHIKHDGY